LRELAGEHHGRPVALQRLGGLVGLGQCVADLAVEHDQQHVAHPAHGILLENAPLTLTRGLIELERGVQLACVGEQVTQLKVEHAELLSQADIGRIGRDELADTVASAAGLSQTGLALVRSGLEHHDQHVSDREIGPPTRIVRIPRREVLQDGA
jgi:hypothetical protein